MCFSVYLAKRNPLFHPLCFPTPLCSIFASLVLPLPLPSIASLLSWLIVAPQLRGWHMHQSLTNTTWSPETHSSTKNVSVFFLSPLLSFRLCHLSMSSISLQSDTRALSSIFQNNYFPVCFRGKDVAVIYENLTLANLYFILTLFTLFY